MYWRSLFCSLPPSYENFRVAIESRDELPEPDALRIKIVEEYDAHRNERQSSSNAMYASKKWQPRKSLTLNSDDISHDKVKAKEKKTSRIKCNKCNLFGHKGSQCRNEDVKKESAKATEQVSLCIGEALLVKLFKNSRKYGALTVARRRTCAARLRVFLTRISRGVAD